MVVNNIGNLNIQKGMKDKEKEIFTPVDGGRL